MAPVILVKKFTKHGFSLMIFNPYNILSMIIYYYMYLLDFVKYHILNL